MPAQLLLVNPSAPRSRMSGTPAQQAARRRFAAMAKSGAFKGARKNPSKKKSKAKRPFASTAFGKQILARKARKNPSRMTAAEKKAVAALAADTGTKSHKETAVAKKKTGAKKAKKKTSAKKKKTSAKKATAKRAAPKKAKAKKTRAKRKTKKVRVSKAQRRREIAMGNAPRRRKRRKARKAKMTAAQKRLAAKRKRFRTKAKASKGASKTIYSMRARAAGLKLRASRKSRKSKKTGKYTGLSPAQRAQLKASGLLKVNPSIMSVIKDMGVLLPQAGMTIAGLAIAALVGQKVVEQARKSMPTQAADPKSLINSPHVPAVIAAAVGAVGYIGARMLGAKPGPVATFVNKLAPSLFIGGLAAAAVHTLANTKVKDAAGADVSLGRRLGLPIGEYVLGEYVVGQGMSNMIDVDGRMVAVDGGVGSIFSRRTLGEYVPNDFDNDGPREAARGRRLEASAAGILKAELAAHNGKLPVDGSLSGSIFDD